MSTKVYFPTLIYSKPLHSSRKKNQAVAKQILRESDEIREMDRGGIAWSDENYPFGFTSYSSANDLHRRSPTFSDLENAIDGHVKRFVQRLGYDMAGAKLAMSNCWVNVMEQGAVHGWHIHPHAVISGTFYVSAPKGSSPIRFEDPRLDRFMGTPVRKKNWSSQEQWVASIPAVAGNLVLFESWLRHEVPTQKVSAPRVSVSFNYSLV